MGLKGASTKEATGDRLAGMTCVIDTNSFPGGWLYIQVATSTVVDPMTNEGVIWNPNRATEARKDNTMDKLVAKPLRMLSEYIKLHRR